MPSRIAAAEASPSAQTASTTAIGRPPIAAMSRDIDHHAAPAGEPWVGGDEGVDEALDRKQEMPVAIRNRGAVVADGNRRARRARGAPRRRRYRPWPRAPGSRAKRGDEGVQFGRVHLRRPFAARRSRAPARGRADRRQIGAHLEVRPAEQVDLVERLPMHLAEERPVLRLHMREKGRAAHGAGRKRRRGGSSVAPIAPTRR